MITPDRTVETQLSTLRRHLAGLCFGIVVLAAMLSPLVAAPGDPNFPVLSGRIVDQAGILGTQDKADIRAKLEALEKNSSDQLVLVTLTSLQGFDIADYGVRLGRHWQIGQKDKNNGVLLIVAPKERKVRIEVGYGLEGSLTDALSTAIIQQKILPRFRAGDMPGGIRLGNNEHAATSRRTVEKY